MTSWMNPRRVSPVEQELQEVCAVLRDLSTEVHESIRPLVTYAALESGKLLRPTLLLLSAGTFGVIRRDHIHAAAVLEILHNATLLHDDVLDRGMVRRGTPTVNRRWGNRVAIRLGDILLGQVV